MGEGIVKSSHSKLRYKFLERFALYTFYDFVNFFHVFNLIDFLSCYRSSDLV